MASSQRGPLGTACSNLDENEVALLDLAAEDQKDILSLLDAERLILRLHDQTQELELEKALLEQELDDPEPTGDVEADEQLRIAERELLEARATYTIRRKAIEAVLMSDPALKAVHLKASSPANRALLPLINRRDLLALVHENIATAHAATLTALSTMEVENRLVTQTNQKLARIILDLTRQNTSWKDEIADADLQAQLREAAADRRRSRAKWDTIKGIVSAVVVGSGVDWARDDQLRELVLDESTD